ncbi:hypothetical protein SCB49_14720 [unidentified eubacterium SCB49]|nr:hypothetical protein SCB49_14720 [unidentified eubacterium SCB49]
MCKPTLKAIHICNSLQPTHKPKIAKEYVFANARKFAERKSQCTTMYKNNSGLIAKTKVSKYKNMSVFNRKVSA